MSHVKRWMTGLSVFLFVIENKQNFVETITLFGVRQYTGSTMLSSKVT